MRNDSASKDLIYVKNNKSGHEIFDETYIQRAIGVWCESRSTTAYKSASAGVRLIEGTKLPRLTERDRVPLDYPWHPDILRDCWDRLCFHEAGHLLMLQYYGGSGFIRLNSPDYSNYDMTPFSGYMRPLSLPSDRQTQRFIGLAGVVAAALLESQHTDGEELMELIAAGEIELSDTDAVLAEGYTYGDVESVFDLMRSMWPQVVEAASWEQGKFPGGDV